MIAVVRNICWLMSKVGIIRGKTSRRRFNILARLLSLVINGATTRKPLSRQIGEVFNAIPVLLIKCFIDRYKEETHLVSKSIGI